MNIHRKKQGSALLIATVVVVIVLGIGGAFLSESLYRRNAQFILNQGDEAQLICDAALEKVRRALYLYRRNGSTNADIAGWCSANSSWSSYQILQDLGKPGDPSSKWSSSLFQNYVISTGQTVQSGNDTSIEAPAFGTADFFLGVNRPMAGGAFFAMVTLTPDGKQFVLDITATLRSGIQRKIEGLLSYDANTAAANFPKLAAIIVGGASTFSGNNTVDGRDYSYDPANPTTPALTTNPAAPAVMGQGTIGYGGAASAGGADSNPAANPAGNAPARGGTAGSLQAGVTDWSVFNAPPADGSPTPKTFPTSPDGTMQLPPGTLMGTAQAQGTYFTTQADYTAYLAANGGSMPSGAVVYCNFTPSPPFEVGSTMNAQSSILVVHNDSGTATMKNVHGNFQGLILADNVDHINAGSLLLGSVFAWGQSGNVFGNGNATVDYSSSALSHLPGLQLQPPQTMSLLSMRKMTP